MKDGPLEPGDHDGVLALLNIGVPHAEASQSQSLIEFCDGRELSLRSRLEMVEHVCSLVGAAHRAGSGFLRISSRSVTVNYTEGGLSIDIPGAITLPGGIEAAREPRDAAGRFSAGEMIRAANVVELGRMLSDLVGRVAKLDIRVADVVERATTLRSTTRLRSAFELRDELVKLRRLWTGSGQLSVESLDAGSETPPHRWSWA